MRPLFVLHSCCMCTQLRRFFICCGRYFDTTGNRKSTHLSHLWPICALLFSRRGWDSNPCAPIKGQTHFECASLWPLRYISKFILSYPDILSQSNLNFNKKEGAATTYVRQLKRRTKLLPCSYHLQFLFPLSLQSD